MSANSVGWSSLGIGTVIDLLRISRIAGLQIWDVHDQLIDQVVHYASGQDKNVQGEETVCDSSGNNEKESHVCQNWFTCLLGICGTWMLLMHDLSFDDDDWTPIETVIANLEEHTCQNALRDHLHQALEKTHPNDGEETCGNSCHTPLHPPSG